MKYIWIFLVFLFVGCSNSAYNWEITKAPKKSMIGHTVQDGALGKRVIPWKKNSVIKSDMADIKSSQYDKINESLNLYFKSSQYKLDETKPLIASGIGQLKIEKFGSVLPIGQPFIYQCVTVEKITFTIIKNKESDGRIISDIAKLTATPASKISISSVDAFANKKEISIKTPDLCLAYTVAQFTEQNFENHKNTTASMFLKNDSKKKAVSNFSLDLGEKSNLLYVKDFQKNSKQKNYFSIEADKTKDNKIVLKVCKAMHQYKEVCNSIEPNSYGKWNKVYPLGYASHTFENKQIYNIFSLVIDAESLSNRSIQINWAKLRQPQYELMVQE